MHWHFAMEKYAVGNFLSCSVISCCLAWMELMEYMPWFYYSFALEKFEMQVTTVSLNIAC